MYLHRIFWARPNAELFEEKMAPSECGKEPFKIFKAPEGKNASHLCVLLSFILISTSSMYSQVKKRGIQ